MDLEKHNSINYLLLFRKYVFHYLFIFAYFKNTIVVLYNSILSKLIKFEIMINKMNLDIRTPFVSESCWILNMHQNPQFLHTA